jgi:hypothetical protein
MFAVCKKTLPLRRGAERDVAAVLEQRADHERLGLMGAAPYFHEAGDRLGLPRRPLAKRYDARRAFHGEHASIAPSPDVARYHSKQKGTSR